MIKFFRKIRQNLLSEGQTEKYLKYAIGEIILVVIGILIAISINNWNQDRKNGELVRSYRENLIENLTKDSLSIRENLDLIKTDLLAIKEIERRVSTPISPLDTIVHIARYDYSFIIYGQFDYEDDTYNVLNATGHIGLFNEEIINDLNILHNLQDFALFAQGQTFETFRNNMAQYAQSYPFSLQNNLIQNGTVAADLVWKNISLTRHATKFNALIIAKGDAYRLSEENLKKVLDKTAELLAKLRKL